MGVKRQLTTRLKLVIVSVIVLPFYLSQAASVMAENVPKPEFHGVYLVANGKLLELRKSVTVMPGGIGRFTQYVSPLSGIDVKDSKAYFIVYDKSVQRGGNSNAKLSRLKIIRILKRLTMSIDGKTVTQKDSKKLTSEQYWGCPDPIDLRTASIKGEPEMIRLVPAEPLSPGVYQLGFGEPPRFDFPVSNPVYDFSVAYKQYDKEGEAQVLTETASFTGGGIKCSVISRLEEIKSILTNGLFTKEFYDLINNISKQDYNTLLVLLKDEDPQVRIGSAEVFVSYARTMALSNQKSGDNRAVEPLIALLKDKDVGVRARGALALGWFKDKRAVPPLTAALKDEAAEVRRSSLFALWKISDRQATDPAIVMLRDPAAGVRQQAAFTLGEIKDPKAVDPLLALLKDVDIDVRSYAIKALGSIGDKRAVEPIAPFLQDENFRLRAAAYQGLSKLEYSNITSMKPEAIARTIGEFIIFGERGRTEKDGIGKGQCSICHSFDKNGSVERGPNLFGITKIASERIKDPRYLKPDFSQVESIPGIGRAGTTVEYLAESNVCPSCFVVEGFGVKGTNDRESPMSAMHKPPMQLTIDEMVAVDMWLYINDGESPPPLTEIRAAYEKFILGKK